MSGFYTEADYLALKRRCEALEEEVAWLRSQLGTASDAQRVLLQERLGVRPGEARMLMCLVDRAPRLARHEALLLAAGSAAQRKIVDCYIARLRSAFEYCDGARDMIVTLPKEGYRLTLDGLAFLQELAPEAFDHAAARIAA